MSKPLYHVVSFSGGKDSTAMVLRMIELGYRIDEVVFCDTTMEFPAMLRHVEKVKKVVERAGIKFTTLRAENSFEWYLTEHLPNRKEGSRYFGVSGYGWPGVFSRWCTKALKQKPIADYYRALREEYKVIQYVGIAADEDYRMERKSNKNPNHRHPLRDWGWSEADAMQYCLGKGYDWEGLYNIFRRVSCWCCPLQPYDELRALRRHFPDLWVRLLDLDSRQCKPFNKSTIKDFDRRFALEDALTAAGHSIKNKAFFADLKRLLGGEATIDDILRGREDEYQQMTFFKQEVTP